MNQIETENAAALAEIYGSDLVDTITGKQAESVQIDGRDILGELSFDTAEIEAVMGGARENLSGIFYTLKQYWPDGNFPQRGATLQCVVNGRVRQYQVWVPNGDKTNRAQLLIGFRNKANEKG